MYIPALSICINIPATIRAPCRSGGDRVESAAEDWLKKPHARPFFLFLHFYDLHGPFLMPSAWRDHYKTDPYDGELAFVDTLISRFRTSVDAVGLAKKTLLVVTADHGEGLGDHGENNHGFFVYHSTTHIPLLIHFPDGRAAGKRIEPVVRLIDVAPTLLSAAGLPPMRGADGVSLLAAIEQHHEALISVLTRRPFIPTAIFIRLR